MGHLLQGALLCLLEAPWRLRRRRCGLFDRSVLHASTMVLPHLLLPTTVLSSPVCFAGNSAGILVFTGGAFVIVAQHRRVALEALPQYDRLGADTGDVVPQRQESGAVAPAQERGQQSRAPGVGAFVSQIRRLGVRADDQSE